MSPTRRSLLKALAALPFWGLAASEVAISDPIPESPAVVADGEWSLARCMKAIAAADWSEAPYEKAMHDSLERAAAKRRAEGREIIMGETTVTLLAEWPA